MEDVPDRALGWRLPRAHTYAQRAELGYGQGALIVCSIGGTRIAKGLLELCGQAYPILRESLPDLRMVLVCGPRLSPDELHVPPGPEIRG